MSANHAGVIYTRWNFDSAANDGISSVFRIVTEAITW